MTAASKYLRFLPEILRGADGESAFPARYLKIFEALLGGRDDAGDAPAALEQIIDSMPARLDPGLTPVEQDASGAGLTSPFLDYLGRWVALTFDQNWGLDKRREWLRQIVHLYKHRGTLAGLSAYLAMFVGNQARVEELAGGFIVGVKTNATVGVSTFIAGAPAYHFRVRINYGFTPDPFDIAVWRNLRRSTRAIVDLEKPAHTYYTLRASTPGIIVGVRATIGKDTLIWQDSRQF
jgi:phage tail-like protein